MRFLILLLIQVIALISLFTNLPVLAFAVNPCPPGMVLIPGGTFKMGADDSGFVEEQTAENVTVTSFCIDKYEVTNAQFAEFVKATNYVTVAERPLSKEQFPDLLDEQRLPGSMVFQMPKQGVKEVQILSWWHWTPSANWQHPFGSDSTIVGKENYPVVHIAYQDAVAYAQWSGKSLPTEAQWEYAARGGLDGATYTWGNQYSVKKANTWQGIFPFFNTKTDGYVGTAKVGSFPANGYGLYDMTGNVWEWTSDLFNDRSPTSQRSRGSVNQSFDPKKPTETDLHVIKGGSYLCAPNYCSRYRPAARESESTDTGTTHIGFRLVKNLQD
ncbi:formylglycine-generating enzyme family protein [Sphaerospermopsis sp. FACHB-1094]|uniref:formylglycine-generating enzyme family protein n=1 Tax=Sphaerospermopsis sp. FACHB-1094 TaxID=2692861 RepID=UPI0016823EFF|nr:formylglycine-generating enzyme family protein [Sphaerospermopsis sp. FACHB-1094]MBD2134877.1 formylglycine-generating enzyme family protein [Sphaerospermopsis sp. FACHB-1094]